MTTPELQFRFASEKFRWALMATDDRIKVFGAIWNGYWSEKDHRNAGGISSFEEARGLDEGRARLAFDWWAAGREPNWLTPENRKLLLDTAKQSRLDLRPPVKLLRAAGRVVHLGGAPAPPPRPPPAPWEEEWDDPVPSTKPTEAKQIVSPQPSASLSPGLFLITPAAGLAMLIASWMGLLPSLTQQSFASAGELIVLVILFEVIALVFLRSREGPSAR